jgi:hypothetical protein
MWYLFIISTAVYEISYETYNYVLTGCYLLRACFRHACEQAQLEETQRNIVLREGKRVKLEAIRLANKEYENTGLTFLVTERLSFPVYSLALLIRRSNFDALIARCIYATANISRLPPAVQFL